MNLLLLGSSGKIGTNLFEKFSKIKSINLYSLSRSKVNSNYTNHKIFDILNNDLEELNFNVEFDIIINCLYRIFKNDKLIFSLYSKCLNLLKSDNNSIWIEISSISVMGFNEPLHSNIRFTSYALDKLKAEKSLIKLSKQFNKNCKIFRFGAVISDKLIENFIQNKFQKFIKLNVFFNFFLNSPYIRITSEEVFKLIDKTIFTDQKIKYRNII